jgi:hypothetical protein
MIIMETKMLIMETKMPIMETKMPVIGEKMGIVRTTTPILLFVLALTKQIIFVTCLAGCFFMSKKS